MGVGAWGGSASPDRGVEPPPAPCLSLRPGCATLVGIRERKGRVRPEIVVGPDTRWSWTSEHIGVFCG